jgi:hypothetical protein
MSRKLVPILATTVLLAVSAVSSVQAFEVGGVGDWKFSTDGIVDVFAPYQTVSALPGGTRSPSLLGNSPAQDQSFSVRVGLLPSVVGFNITAPTVNGVESKVRIGIYPNIQNGGENRFDTSPNIDFREIYYTAKGSYGELLAGRALNLYQGKNILTDMTLLTAGVVGSSTVGAFDLRGGTTLGHIGYGYLYTNFGPQLRYTTPDLNGAKVALSVNQPYKISADTGKTNSPRVETEISYNTTVGGNPLATWGSAMYQTAPRTTTATARPGESNQSIGGALGVQYGFSGLDLLASGYYGKGLGMVSVQDGDLFGPSSTDGAGNERTQYGFLAQATYKLTPDWKVGVNYGQSAQKKSAYDNAGLDTTVPTLKQEAAVAMLAYNLTKQIQFVGEYTYAQNTWMDGAKQHSNSIALGTMFYW